MVGGERDLDDWESIISDSLASSVDHEQVEPYDFNNLPFYACSYCGIHDPETVVKCIAKGCEKWFCNGKGTNEYGSHIILHMVKARHKEIAIHPESHLRDTTIECYQCSSKNLFLLGFVSAKQDTVIMILCREPCLSQLGLKDSKWDTDNWHALIENKALLNWMVRYPTEIEFKRSRQINSAEINKLEELWKEKPTAQIADLS